jgi:PIN domain nuclease of toxin-antitoxin system
VIYLLDTHTFLWAAFSPENLSPAASKEIRLAENQIYLSTISLWEISLKYALGKMSLENCQPDDMPDIATQMHIQLIQPTDKETASFYRLPRTAHKDPFERMIIWQAIQQQIALISKDTHFAGYEKFGLSVLW